MARTSAASLGGEAGAAKIYWALVGQRVVVLTYFGPDKQTKQLSPAWDLVRTSLKVVDPKATPSAIPKHHRSKSHATKSAHQNVSVNIFLGESRLTGKIRCSDF